jgi:SAM-dependent methyltransferase
MFECIVCKNSNIKKEFDSQISITSFSVPIKLPIEVYLCENCGHIFSPPNQLPSNFYEEDYSLLLEDKESEFVVFEEGKENTLFNKVLQFIFQNIDPKKIEGSFHVLEVGAGKGILLKRLKEFVNYPVAISAVEPNQKSEVYLKNNLPGHEISLTTLENSPFKDKVFNLILSHGVLEHVPDPVDFLKNICACMNAESFLYIGVPNFIANPADLVTTDHLSKFLPSTIEFLFHSVGLKVLSSNASDSTVFMSYILQKNEQKDNDKYYCLKDIKESSEKVLKSSVDYIKASLKAFEKAVEESIQRSKDLSIYGAGNIGLLALKYFNIPESKIKGIYDDNRTFWGTSRMGIPIKNPQELTRNKDSIIYISANSCYHKEITKKINALTHNKASIYPKVRE